MDGALFNSREIASMAWLGVLLLGFLWASRKQGSILDLLMPVLTLLRFWFLWAYVGLMLGVLVPASILGLWEPGLWKTTVLWLLLAGFGLFSKFTEAIKEPGFFKHAIRRSVGVVVVVEFVANLASYPLWAELVTQPILFFSVVAANWPAKNQEPSTASKLANRCLSVYGLAAVTWGSWKLAEDWSGLEPSALAREFLLPVWLSGVALVYVYSLGVFSTYQLAFFQIDWAADEQPQGLRRLAVVLRTRGQPERLRILDKAGGQRLAHPSGFKDAWNEVGRVMVGDRACIAAEEAAERRLIENAGVAGVDSDGKQLDEREHAETKKALQWLADRQVGEHRRTGRYQGRVQVLADNLSEHLGLPVPNDIRVHVSGDGQRWYAERETVTGHWFAVGASEPPADIWFYDGPQPPSGYPDDAEWDQLLSDNHAVNWN